jgi:hypothetical protein
MNILSFVLFAHVVGVIGLFLTIGFEWIADVGGAMEFPRLYRASLALIVFPGIYLTRAMLQGTSATVSELGWLVMSVPALVVVAMTGASRTRRLRSLSVRTSLSLALVLLMIAKPPLKVSLGLTVAATILGLFSRVLARRRHVLDNDPRRLEPATVVRRIPAHRRAIRYRQRVCIQETVMKHAIAVATLALSLVGAQTAFAQEDRVGPGSSRSR